MPQKTPYLTRRPGPIVVPSPSPGAPMADTVKKKKGLFAKIETRDDALKTIRECAIGFFFVAGPATPPASD